MLATLIDAPFDQKGWIFEDKYDGFRVVATIEGGQMTLYSRNGKIIGQNYTEVAKALEGIKQDAVIDGELVAIDRDGVSRFQLLQNARRRGAKLQYCAFDLMFQDGDDLRGHTLLERKKRLQAILPNHNRLAFSRHRATFGVKFFNEADRHGLEGIMAKRADSQYLSGARTDNWLKINTSKRQEVVIAGFYSPEADAALLRSIGARHPRRQGMALHWARRNRLQPCDVKRSSRQADQIEDGKISFPKKSERRTYYNVGKAHSCGK
jgi:bifunctional non-homologous end joining protein LigD